MLNPLSVSPVNGGDDLQRATRHPLPASGEGRGGVVFTQPKPIQPLSFTTVGHPKGHPLDAQKRVPATQENTTTHNEKYPDPQSIPWRGFGLWGLNAGLCFAALILLFLPPRLHRADDPTWEDQHDQHEDQAQQQQPAIAHIDDRLA